MLTDTTIYAHYAPECKCNIPIYSEDVIGAVNSMGWILRRGPRGALRWEHPEDSSRYVHVKAADRHGTAWNAIIYEKQPEEIKNIIIHRLEEIQQEYPNLYRVIRTGK